MQSSLYFLRISFVCLDISFKCFRFNNYNDFFYLMNFSTSYGKIVTLENNKI